MSADSQGVEVAKNRDAEGVEESVRCGVPSPADTGLGSVVSSPSGVRGRTLAASVFSVRKRFW